MNRARGTRWVAALSFAAVGAFCGCNPFHNFYVDVLASKPPDQQPRILPADEPEVFAGKEPDADARALLANGYVLIGYASFQVAENWATPRQAAEKGRDVGAAAVVIYSRYARTVSGVTEVPMSSSSTTMMSGNIGGMPVAGTSVTSTTSMQWVPYDVARYDWLATYWARTEPPILGAYCTDLPPEIRSRLKRNQGCFVQIVVKNSPAYAANIVPSDVVIAVGDENVDDASAFEKILRRRAGSEVDLRVLRDGQSSTIHVRLNSLGPARARVSLVGYSPHDRVRIRQWNGQTVEGAIIQFDEDWILLDISRGTFSKYETKRVLIRGVASIEKTR